MGLASVDAFVLENSETGELVGIVFRKERAEAIVKALGKPYVYHSAKEFLSGIEWKALKAVIRWLKKLLGRKNQAAIQVEVVLMEGVRIGDMGPYVVVPMNKDDDK